MTILGRPGERQLFKVMEHWTATLAVDWCRGGQVTACDWSGGCSLQAGG